MDAAQRSMKIDEYLKKSEQVDYSVHLPEAELDVMMAIWKLEPPVTTAMLMKEIGDKHEWKTPTLISFLLRLEDRGYIISYKNGRERYYIPIAERELYLSRVTENFVEQYHSGSLIQLLDALYYEKSFDEDIDELLEWIKSRYGG